MGHKSSKGAKGKGLSGDAYGAVPKPDTYLVDVLRAYPADDGSIFIKRAKATRDVDLVSTEGMSTAAHGSQRGEPSAAREAAFNARRGGHGGRPGAVRREVTSLTTGCPICIWVSCFGVLFG